MTRIPKILHYVFGMASDFGGKPWSLVHHVCLKSAVERIAPDQVFLYYEFEPSGPWWKLSRGLVTPVKIEAPREVFGRPLTHVAHRADVVRLQKLIEHGGIYLDSDVFVRRSFDDLLNHPTVLAQQGVDGKFGLCNAVILAEPQSAFLRRWLAEYRTFHWSGRQDESWDEHSVRLPLKLACDHPSEITVLPHTAFFWPRWDKEDLDWIFLSGKPIPAGETYANHLWESHSWGYMENVTLQHVRSKEFNFNIWARPLLKDLPDHYGALNWYWRRAKKRTLKKTKQFKDLFARAARRARRLIASERGAVTLNSQRSRCEGLE